MTSPRYVVGIGASAGGLEAIESFFRQMPTDSGAAFVVIQHLSPDYKSLMVELLTKHTTMPVLRSEDGMTVQADHVYLIPPGKNLRLFHGKLLLSDQEGGRGINLPIDIFLRALAEDQGEKSIAIILSGTGSDGTRGIRAVKEQGGMIMVQSEETARFDGMPKSAINTGLADFVLGPEDMPVQLLSYMKHPTVTKAERSTALASDEDGLTRIFALLRERSKLDFTFYKPSTVIRRIERRMTVNQVQELRDYVRFLERFPGEVGHLYRELLIGVTRFFRDKPAWDWLDEQVLPDVFERANGREVRMWVAGCSTGEEAYTLAMVCREVMERLGRVVDVKIFATDVDRDAVQRAGAGVYPESIVADLSPALLGKYFQRRDENFHVARGLREMVVFAPHNLLKDPPFTNIDFISCRNLLIYLQPVLQKKTLDLFSFSLRQEGVLLLGSSETIGDSADVYEPLHPKWRIYRAKAKRRLSDAHEINHFSGTLASSELGRPLARGALRPVQEDRLLGRLLEGLSGRLLPLTLVVNERMELLHVEGDAEGVLRLPSGRMRNDVTRLVSHDLAIPLATGLQKVFKTGEGLVYTNVHLKGPAGVRTVDLRLMALPGRKGDEALAAVLVQSVGAREADGAQEERFDLDRVAEQRIRDLEGELQFTRENLQATVEELETANEELQAANEELLASNEELQSTNEELQSVNEELYTVNAEFQTKIAELSQLNNDLDNLISGSEIATLFLDAQLRVRRYTPALTRLCRIIDSDIGRPITDLSHQMLDVDLSALAQQVQMAREALDLEVRTRDGRWYLLNAHPYCIGRQPTGSVVMNLVEVTELKNAQETLARSQARHAQALRAVGIALWDWDIVAGTLTWSESIEALTCVSVERLGNPFESFGEMACPDDRARLRQALIDCVEHGQRLEIDFGLLRTEGLVSPVRAVGVVRRDESGRAVRLLGMLHLLEVQADAETSLPCLQGTDQ
ncbi:MAG: chemotaxis protein CheB [Halothiobacillaceae bacterium]|nr:chemotaxis protein CheB [Halothiobacillaceae bacterium]